MVVSLLLVAGQDLNLRPLGYESDSLITGLFTLGIAEEIASKLQMFSEEQQIIASGTSEDISNDQESLHRCNLAYYHAHTPIIDF